MRIVDLEAIPNTLVAQCSLARSIGDKALGMGQA